LGKVSDPARVPRRVVQFGAGAIGRGLLGELYVRSGWETVFVDVKPELVELLNRRRSYALRVVGGAGREVEISRFRAVDGRDPAAVAGEVAAADLVATAVRKENLPAVALTLGGGIALRSRIRPESALDVLVCENLFNAPAVFRRMLEDALADEGAGALDYLARRTGVVGTVVQRTVPAPRCDPASDRPLLVVADEEDVLPCDAGGFRGGVPAIRGLRPVGELAAYEERKLYAHNCGHALAAYFGWAAGHELVWRVMEDPDCARRVRAGMEETAGALCAKHGFDRAGHANYLARLMRTFGLKELGDTVARVGRDPWRKLGPDDRLVGAARLALEHGTTPKVLAEGIAAAIRFRPPGDPTAPEIAELIARGGPECVLREVSRLDPARETDRRLLDLALEAYSVGA
jgi:mannitol-1-phosphate 5-dehydrogenase